METNLEQFVFRCALTGKYRDFQGILESHVCGFNHSPCYK